MMFDGFLARALGRASEVLPSLAFAVLALVVGWLLAVVVRWTVQWLVRRTGLEALGEKAGFAKFIYAVGARKGLARLLGQVAYLATILLAVSAAADILNLTAVATIVTSAIAYLPRLLSALGVFIAGLWIANMLRRWVSSGTGGSRLSSPALVGQLAYYAVLVVAITMAAEQAGLDTALVAALIAIVVGAVAFGFAAALAFGAKVVFESLVARHYCESTFRVGDIISLDGASGPLVRYTSTSALIHGGGDHIVAIPCADLLRRAVRVNIADRPGDDDLASEPD